ncbi:MAG: amidohydrolase family protein [Candidatus Aenigmarchaeota archaeon]|nr:amidohydrolase family protein [Candidatus Aenigmarchaeota archaeon]
MIIDFHTHLGKPKKGVKKPEISSGVEDIIKIQKEANIDKSVIFAMPQEPFLEKNKEANMEVFTAMGPFIPFIWINPYFFDKKEVIDSIKRFNVRGVKLHSVFDGYYPSPKFLKDIIELSVKLNIPVLFHSLWGDLGDVKHIEKVAESFPRAKIVIAHLKESGCIDVAKKLDNVYIDTSYCPHPRGIEQAVKAIGAERILFGSDFPFNDPVVQKMMIERAKIKERDKQVILGGNAIKLLNL